MFSDSKSVWPNSTTLHIVGKRNYVEYSIVESLKCISDYPEYMTITNIKSEPNLNGIYKKGFNNGYLPVWQKLKNPLKSLSVRGKIRKKKHIS